MNNLELGTNVGLSPNERLQLSPSHAKIHHLLTSPIKCFTLTSSDLKKFGPNFTSHINPPSSQTIIMENIAGNLVGHKDLDEPCPNSNEYGPANITTDLQPRLVTATAAGLRPELVESVECEPTSFATVDLQPSSATFSATGLQPKLVDSDSAAGLQPKYEGLTALPDMTNILELFGINVNNFRYVKLKDYNFRQFKVSGANELSISQRVKLFRRGTQASSSVNSTTSLGPA